MVGSTKAHGKYNEGIRGKNISWSPTESTIVFLDIEVFCKHAYGDDMSGSTTTLLIVFKPGFGVGLLKKEFHSLNSKLLTTWNLKDEWINQHLCHNQKQYMPELSQTFL